MKKIAILLSLLMLISPIAMTACSESAVNNEDTTSQASVNDPNAAASETEEAPEQTITDIVKEKYAGTDLGGYEYRVLAPGNGEHFYNNVAANTNEVYAEEMNGELINDAIWERNALTQDFLNITITPVWANGNTDGITNQLKTEVLAGTTAYDTVLNRMDFLGTSMMNGHLLNLNSIPTLDTTNPWWDKNIVDNFNVFDNRLYFLSGDINIFDDFAVEVIFFNKQLCDDNSMTYPYGDVI